jgi:hypothetical protein
MNPQEFNTHYQITLERLFWIADEMKSIKLDTDSRMLVILLSENATRLKTIFDALNGMADDLTP